MATKTSKLKAINPKKWGYRKVNIIFGVVRDVEDQSWVVAGDLIQDSRGSVWEFKYRMGDMLHGLPVKL
jgi:hypothetical protein